MPPAKPAPKNSLDVSFIAFHIIGLLLFSGIGVYRYYHRVTSDQPDFSARIAQLTTLEVDLNNLSDYIRSQKNTLQSTSQALETLKHEKSQTEAALKVDRDNFNAVISSLNYSSAKDRWIERSISFVIGVFSSLLASQLWHVFRRNLS
jgi:septal ring factor EnvC (AmiA/AmiB activator)